ncbi:hypothetical protein HMP0015_0079 [Acinetobacter haemolyticus ATCC 19194]|uniref:Uncharacterized protein n=1 Tax=Acinetobacter haemolyticus ATCC 19194 TaxID=707232 RepID=D4XK37_ACIHA|nr:hypothetical protein HMP0015_0079 [Acinetobacter haemolyticus ATCC 19194]
MYITRNIHKFIGLTLRLNFSPIFHNVSPKKAPSNSFSSNKILLGYCFIKKTPEYFIFIKNILGKCNKIFQCLKILLSLFLGFLKYIHEALKVSLGFNKNIFKSLYLY